jgi:ATP-dependent DNA helicase RecG
MLNLDSEILYLKNIGPKYNQAFAKLGIRTVEDMLTFFPVQYQDRRKIISIKDVYKQFQVCCLFVKIGKFYEKMLPQGLFILDVEIFDDTSMAYARFFRKKKLYSNIDIFANIKKTFESGRFVYIYGVVRLVRANKFIAVNDYEIVKNKSDIPTSFNRIIPVYPSTKGLSQRFIRKTVKTVIESSHGLYPDVSELVPNFNNIRKLNSSLAIQKIHYPNTLEDAENARRFFALQEFFIFETAVCLSRYNVKKNPKIQKYAIRKTLLTTFKNNLKFEFTKSQKKAINNIFADMQSIYPMNRMLLGDVGSGKTVVALSAVLLAIESGYQVMILAPTEILAEQHYLTISNMFSGIDVKTVLVTSHTLKKKSVREKLLIDLATGDIKITIGTHSLIENRIKFKNLSLIILDEQHRFGVMQKLLALKKGKSPDILMMTATPIPRALAITLYGDMDMTVITHPPLGRIPVKTYFSNEQIAYMNTIKELENGNQAYIVYPIIDESDKLALKSAVQESEKLSKTWFKDFKVGLLHGKMKPSEKNEIMQKFKNKEFNVLISTTVIEVGIDVHNATIIIIHHAERFGLSALHQLRGRVGRSTKQAYAYLICTSNNEAAYKKLSIMISTNNGFKIAEEDLKLRGPGEIMGTIQHGFPKFRAGNLRKDTDIIAFARKIASEVIKKDLTLSRTENFVLKKMIYKRFSSKIKFINVG